jgi:N-acetylneuraminate synthase/sialic acid synthase
MEKMIRDLKNTKLALGDGVKKVLENEINPIKKMSKRLVYSQDVSKGAVLSEKMIEMRSPGGGIYPDQISNFIGKNVNKNVREGESLNESDI